jgi:starch synthase
MYSLRYGTPPIVRATGGLDDTVRGFDPETGEGNGFKFEEFETSSMMAEVRRAVEVYRNREKWERLMRNGMREDFSWSSSVAKYEELYECALQSGNRQ